MNLAERLAQWGCALEPTDDDVALARNALVDTVAVTLAGRSHPVHSVAGELGEAGQWAAVGHVLDFDDLHMRSTTHISVVCANVALATGGASKAYLAGAGVMARLGTLLGWSHYARGWHATCTAGAPAAAVTASVAMGLSARETATALALAVPAAGGVQRAFGTDAKSLQVGFAADAGVRAARLAAAGAEADTSALAEWLRLVGARHDAVDLSGPAVPGGLAVKLYPACYALQRPISALDALTADGVRAADITKVVVKTPEATVAPLIHHRPRTGLQAKFSLEYAVAAALLDEHQGFESFTDAAVQRDEAQRLVQAVELRCDPGGEWLLDGEVQIEVHLDTGTIARTSLDFPPGSPQRPLDEARLERKFADCMRRAGLPGRDHNEITWDSGAQLLRQALKTA
ncbi:MmgE/PrpD family protein [Nocardia sp. NBC_00508]|uniref:MmgE/PrpD family protein n=1 Tax=Nocardia sp. NBC_00508 TaxID=2975992 RepID=UPI002E80960C|nr:MmgE/PrpD family protein [Nocardia sp. NBC_00508]WUD67075.1 MmgE/PrpD family protein [Nocardia sp. NBC_00508]